MRGMLVGSGGIPAFRRSVSHLTKAERRKERGGEDQGDSGGIGFFSDNC
jgi:hypothetical protein